MDLQTVKEELLSGNYETPMAFAKDMRLIFQNSRNYNTNQRSRVSFTTNSNRFQNAIPKPFKYYQNNSLFVFHLKIHFNLTF